MIITVSFIVYEVSSSEEDNIENESNTETHYRNIIFNAIVLLLVIIFFIYKEIKELI